MEGFHRFMASKIRQQSPIRSFGRNNQQNKEVSHNEDENYLMDDEEEQQNDQKSEIKQQQGEEDDMADPLDAFMSNLQQLNRNEESESHVNGASMKVKKQKAKQTQINLQFLLMDEEEGIFSQESDGDSDRKQKHNENVFKFGQKLEDDSGQRYDGQICENEDMPVEEMRLQNCKKNKKVIQTLKPFDFATIQLEDFQKDFYTQHPDITRLTSTQLTSLRKQFQIKVYGEEVPRPIVSFAHLELHPKIKYVLTKQQFEKPTPIQSQALPVAFKGRDLIGVAKTGSGKTLAYVLPLITHVAPCRLSSKNQGPIALVLAPTRELCQQIFLETRKYAKKFDIKIGCLLGGENKHEQWKMLRAGIDVLIASPGRLIEMIKKKATNTHRVTYLVLDEADKMLSLGFEHQIRSIISQTRPDRQTLLFTATMKQQIQFLAYDILQSPIRIVCGDQQSANQNVKQEVVIVEEQRQKRDWLDRHLQEMLKEGKVLIFCNQKERCEEVREAVEESGVEALTLYGDKSQYERTIVMNAFKATAQVLIATDIASRGIDVKAIKTVINYECPQNIESYIHRIGRAGRADQTGTAISLLLKNASSIKFAIQLVKILENTGYPVTKELDDLACMDQFYRRKRISSKMGVSFAKGKDASRFLNQILKQQQRGNSKAGIGMNLNLAAPKHCFKKAQVQYTNTEQKNHKTKNKYNVQDTNNNLSSENTMINQKEKTIAQILREKQLDGHQMTISQISQLIMKEKEKKDQNSLSSRELNNKFVKASTNEWDA